ncbi:galectin-3b [Brachyistius frenatus]|uniref:galectin-3b n=1 Tax=Brachyistius frenatus TaxID=100188 RepID=UPI0037E75B7B
MDLSDALGDWPGSNNQSGGQPTNPTWPGQPGSNPTWPGGQPGSNPTWPGGQPGSNPTWPGGQPGSNPTWPAGQPGSNPTWPAGQPGSNPTWPAGQPGPNPTWPGNTSGGGTWSGGNPSQPSAPGGWPSPSPGPGPQHGPGSASLAVPYNHNLPSGVHDKLLITIIGTIKPNAQKITVDMGTSHDLAFHFNPRFNEDGRKVIVRNSRVGDKWGKEERELSTFPFHQGQQFEMKIMCTNREFKVAVNNSHLLEFKHRITNLQSINKLMIHYDLTLSRVHMEKLP